MEEEKFEIQAMDFMSGNMSDVEAKDFERFLKEHGGIVKSTKIY